MLAHDALVAGLKGLGGQTVHLVVEYIGAVTALGERGDELGVRQDVDVVDERGVGDGEAVYKDACVGRGIFQDMEDFRAVFLRVCPADCLKLFVGEDGFRRCGDFVKAKGVSADEQAPDTRLQLYHGVVVRHQI